MKFPSIKSVAAELSYIKDDLKSYSKDEVEYIEVRLQVHPNGSWQVWAGDPCYDTDHRGYWGASEVWRDTNVRALAKELIEEARAHHSQSRE